MNLTQEQVLFAQHPDEAFVQACPGAGKTRTIIARLNHLSQTLPPRKGIAVLSFTNKAIEEFTFRISKESLTYIVKHPGFVGTFDAFVRHFLFSPFAIRGYDGKPQVIDSWDSLDGTEIRLRGQNSFPGPGVKLDWFDSETNTINPETITNIALRNHVIEHKSDYESNARVCRERLHRLGFYSASDARFIALLRVRHEQWGIALGKAIAGRFSEIIIDEAQDCNKNDLEILDWLRQHGVKVTAVCDMDQSIYAFRDGARTNLEHFAESYSRNNRLHLTGNFRSSPAICQLSSTLKNNNEIDDSLGETSNTTLPVVILPYSGRKVTSSIGQWFLSYVESLPLTLSRHDLIVLAHGAKTARAAAGNYSEATSGKTKIEFLAKALNEFESATTGSARKACLSSVEKLILDVTGQKNKNESDAQTIKRLNLDERRLKRQALTLISSLPSVCKADLEDRNQWIECVRDTVLKLGIPLPDGISIKSIFRTPTTLNWLTHLEQAETGTGLKFSTIHNAKGGQYPAVCVVIPLDDSRSFTTQFFNSWETRTDFEPKRVIYVGVTRAETLAVLAIPKFFLDQCHKILDTSKVTYTTVTSLLE